MVKSLISSDAADPQLLHFSPYRIKGKVPVEELLPWKEIGTMTRVQNRDDAVLMSHNANKLEKGINIIILFSFMGKSGN